jgi:hypothetical protein
MYAPAEHGPDYFPNRRLEEDFEGRYNTREGYAIYTERPGGDRRPGNAPFSVPALAAADPETRRLVEQRLIDAFMGHWRLVPVPRPIVTPPPTTDADDDANTTHTRAPSPAGKPSVSATTTEPRAV